VSIRRLRQPAGRVEIGIAGTEGGRERPLLDRGTGLVGRPGESAIPAREGIDELADPFDDLDLQAGMILLGRVQVHLQVGRPAPQGLLDEPDGEIAFIVDELLLMITFQGEHAKDQPIDGRHAWYLILSCALRRPFAGMGFCTKANYQPIPGVSELVSKMSYPMT
jgi:hypothetical protein